MQKVEVAYFLVPVTHIFIYQMQKKNVFVEL